MPLCFLFIFTSVLHVYAAFNDPANPDATWSGNSVHPNTADSNRWCYFPVPNFTQDVACTGGHATDSAFQPLLYTHLNLSEGYSIAYYAIDSITLLGDSSFPVPPTGARLCLSGQALNGGYQTLCMTSHYDNNIAEPGPYCMVALGQSHVSDGCYKPISAAATSVASLPATSVASQPATSVASLPATFAASLPATTFTGIQPSQTALSQDNTAKLQDCRPCGSNECTYSNVANISSQTYPIIVGIPLENCDPNSNTSITSAIGGSVTISDAWSETNTLGVNVLGVNVDAQFGWSKSRDISYSQTITIEVLPGHMGALVANVLYKRSHGDMEIGSKETFPLISNQPNKVVSYGQQIIPCGSQFEATQSSQLNCTSQPSDALVSAKGYNPLIVSLLPLMASVLVAL